LSYRVVAYLDNIEKHKIIKCEKSKNKSKIEKPKSYGSLGVNNGLENFKETNVAIVEPKSIKLDNPIIEIIELDLPCSLRDHFYPP